MKTGWDAAVRDVSADPVCASVFVEGEHSDQEENLDEKIGVDSTVSIITKGGRNICCSVFATENAKSVGCYEKCAS